MHSPDVKAVVFDMDGVLLDSERITRIMWKKAAEEYAAEDIETAVRECTGRSVDDTCDYLHERYGQDFPAREFRMRCSELFHEYVDVNGLPLMRYAPEILAYLKDAGYVLALASSTRQETVRKELKAAGLIDYFKTITCGDMVTHSKPNPEIYLAACRSIRIAPADCVAVEDSPNGIISAYRAGMKPVMVPDQIQPTAELRNLLFRLCSSLEGLRDFL